jgi:Sulfotransferase domain
LRFALFDLGYSDVYHYSHIYENPKDAELWLEAFQAKYQGKGKPYGRREWDALLGHWMVRWSRTSFRFITVPLTAVNTGRQAVSDTPAVQFYKELLEAYPEAKVILTVRDTPEQWHFSVLSTIQPFLDWRHGIRPGLYDRLYRYLLPKDAFWHMNEVLR